MTNGKQGGHRPPSGTQPIRMGPPKPPDSARSVDPSAIVRSVTTRDINDEIGRALIALHGLPAACDHVGQDGVGNHINDAVRSLQQARKELEQAAGEHCWCNAHEDGHDWSSSTCPAFPIPFVPITIVEMLAASGLVEVKPEVWEKRYA